MDLVGTAFTVDTIIALFVGAFIILLVILFWFRVSRNTKETYEAEPPPPECTA